MSGTHTQVDQIRSSRRADCQSKILNSLLPQLAPDLTGLRLLSGCFHVNVTIMQPLDPKNPVAPVPGRHSHGPYMIWLGAAAALCRAAANDPSGCCAAEGKGELGLKIGAQPMQSRQTSHVRPCLLRLDPDSTCRCATLCRQRVGWPAYGRCCT